LRQPDRFFNTHHRFFYSLLRQLDRQLPTEVQRVHQPIGTVQIIRTYLNSSTFKQLTPMMAAQIDRMPANFLCRVSKGRLFNTLQHFLLSLLRQPDR